MNYVVNGNISDGIFAVPNSVADDYIKLASGKAAKVLIYIMRHGSADTDSAEAIAGALDKRMTAEDVEDAFSYWEQVGIIRRSDKPVQQEACESIRSASSSAQENKGTKTKQPVSAVRAAERSTKMLSPKEIAERVSQSEEVAFLLKSAENILGKVLNNTEQRTLIWIHDYYSIGCDIILMIIDFCKSINKASVGYIEKIAAEWNDNGITTHELAEAEILRLQSYYSLEGQIISRLGLNRILIKKEKEYVSEWAKNGITIELIEYAYEKTVSATGKAAFGYMNKILSEWSSNNLHSIAEVDLFNENYSRSKRRPARNDTSDNSGEHSYNLDLLLEHAMNNIPTYKES